MSLKQNIAVKIVAVYAGVGFLMMEILYYGVWCRPFNQYWAVPPDNTQCSAATNHLITNAVLNISSDLMIIMIPMPVLLQAQLPIKKKAILCGVFALGTFTVSHPACTDLDTPRGVWPKDADHSRSTDTCCRLEQVL